MSDTRILLAEDEVISRMDLREMLENLGYIVIGEALAWHWDIHAAGVDLWKYRGMLLRLLESAGFGRFDTDEPEIRAYEANVLIARIGAGTSAADRRAFREALHR